MIMPFGIPSEDFHGGFGLPHDDDYIEECIHTPEKTGAAMKHISELMDKHRAEHPEVYEVNVETDKYADLGFGENWVSESPEMLDEDREIAEAAQEAHDNLVRSLIEAGLKICEARELLTRSLEMLYLLGYDSGFTNPEMATLTTDIKKFLEDTE